jgi:type I restriction enzyme, R subunit
MTTGYDCQDLLNVVLARPIFSPSDYIQIKGRGTRLFTFEHRHGKDKKAAAKDNYHLFDFFANHQYFEDEFDYKKRLEPPPISGKPGRSSGALPQ